MFPSDHPSLWLDFTQPPQFAVYDPLLTAESWADYRPTTIIPARFKDQPHLMPCMIDLEQCGTAARLELQERFVASAYSRTPSLCAMLWAPVTADAVARHLAQRMVMRLPGGQDVWFRFFDPRVMRHLPLIYNPRQQAHLLGPITAWLYLDAGVPMKVENPALRKPAAAARPMPLTAEQVQRLKRIPVVNEIEAALSSLEPNWAASRRLDIIDRLVERAETTHGLSAAADQVEFALLAVTVHPRFDEHPEVRTALHAAADTGFRSQVLDWTPAKWQQIAQALDAPVAARSSRGSSRN